MNYPNFRRLLFYFIKITLYENYNFFRFSAFSCYFLSPLILSIDFKIPCSTSVGPSNRLCWNYSFSESHQFIMVINGVHDARTSIFFSVSSVVLFFLIIFLFKNNIKYLIGIACKMIFLLFHFCFNIRSSLHKLVCPIPSQINWQG